ncbi:MAG: CBS domain-containing protein [Candidatus Promineifilaceae bacterium]
MLTVRDLMSANPETISPDTLLRAVVEVMKVAGCRQLPVVDEHGRIIGIVTDRDVRLAMNSPMIMRSRWEDEELVEKATVDSCMTPDPITINSDAPAYRAAEILSTYKFGALPVVDNGELVGIITVTDFLDRFTVQQPQNHTTS